MLDQQLLLGLTSIVVLGIGSQWLAWRLRVPSILLLLLAGFIAGPVTGFLDPDVLLGDLLLPIVSVSVAIILFEGGLSLRLSELRGIGSVVRNLITVGLLVTWLVAVGAAYVILGFDLGLSVLFGAIAVVTGPTVIVPLLRHLRLKRRVGAILKWEGIVIDPIAAIIAVLVFEALLAGGAGEATALSALGLIKTLSIGAAIGFIGAEIMVLILSRYWVPDFLHASVTLMVVISAYTSANVLQLESGLIAVTLMGLILANQKTVAVKHIVKFKENLRIVLISALFIILAARVEIVHVTEIAVVSLIFLGALVFVARPLAVFFSTLRSDLDRNERIMIGSIAPRGIVAAAVSSVVGLRLSEAGYAQAEIILPLTFIVIVGTVVIYGALGAPIARRLRLADPNPQGVLIVGAQSWARTIGEVLKAEGYQVLLADTNHQNVTEARRMGLPAYHGNILYEHLPDEVDLAGIGRILALTSNDEVNALACLNFTDLLDSAEVFQLVPKDSDGEKDKKMHTHGRLLFDAEATYEWLGRAFRKRSIVKALLNKVLTRGGHIQKIELQEDIEYEGFRKAHSAVPLFLIDENRRLSVFAVDNRPAMRAGTQVIYLSEKERK